MQGIYHGFESQSVSTSEPEARLCVGKGDGIYTLKLAARTSRVPSSTGIL